MAFGKDNLMEGFQEIEKEYEVTPKSVSSATSIYLPRIMNDFPEFHYNEMKNKAENLLVSYLQSIDENSDSRLAEAYTSELRDKLRMRIKMLRDRNTEEHFQEIRVHRTEIKTYRKEKGRCSIVFQAAVQYFHFVMENGALVEGSRDRLTQSKYDIEMIYIQDRDVVENQADAGLAMNCPNCGAPLPGLGAKICLYCDSPIMEFNIKVWNFSNVEEK